MIGETRNRVELQWTSICMNSNVELFFIKVTVLFVTKVVPVATLMWHCQNYQSCCLVARWAVLQLLWCKRNSREHDNLLFHDSLNPYMLPFWASAKISCFSQDFFFFPFLTFYFPCEVNLLVI